MLNKPLNWPPSASCETLIARAKILKKIRMFFDERGVVEVETPLLSRATITDPHLEGFPVQVGHETCYLQTSPEYAMKRLLAAGMPDIYQLSKMFRVDESARLHNPEFTMLEWYRLGFDLHQLMDEVDALFQEIAQTPKAQRITYQDIFAQIHLDPFSASKNDCLKLALERGLAVSDSVIAASKDTWLQLLFSTFIEPHLGFDTPVFVYDFPASQASLARLHPDDPNKAMRVEVFINGMELGNGFDELQDPTQQRSRFEADNAIRSELGLPLKPIDPYLLAALEQGLPQCSGIAIGIDRLIMCALQKNRIEEVLCFDWSRA
jgi:lysyl-tRNA synthetase class 2